MPELMTTIGPALIALGPFGIMLLVALILVGFLLAFRKNKFEEDKNIAGFRADGMDDMREDITRERSLRRDAEKQVRRYMEALTIWCGYAHGQQMDRLIDRQKHQAYEIKAGIEPLILPDIKDLPRLTEADEMQKPEGSD